jgi:phospholipid transport system transporter-binding protein
MPKTSATAALTRTGDGTYQVSGQLVFASVREVLRSSATVFQNEAQTSIDLSGVQAVDSAGLALLIEWYRTAEKAKRAIRFVGAPAQLRALAKISDIETVLPFA